MNRVILLILIVLATSLFSTPCLSDSSIESLMFDEDIEEVLTPTRLRQSIRDIPASVTVITREQLESLGISTIHDALRLVPGMVVWPAAGNDYRIEYHATSVVNPRRMQVLVDGVSWYRVAFSSVHWTTLPVTVNELNRIEVTRSPSTASYGSNSYTAVVNIITRGASEFSGTTIESRVGDLNTEQYYINTGVKLSGPDLNVSFYHFQNSGFDNNASKGHPKHDSINSNRFTLRTQASQNKVSFRGEIGFTESDVDQEIGDDQQLMFPENYKKEYFAHLNIVSHFGSTGKFDLNVYSTAADDKKWWRTCGQKLFMLDELNDMYEANEAYALSIINGQVPTGGSAEDDAIAAILISKIDSMGVDVFTKICGNINENIKDNRTALDFTASSLLTNNIRGLAGINLRRDVSSSETFFQGTIDRNVLGLFTTFEYKPSSFFTANFGGMWESSVIDDDQFEFAPRGSLNFHLNSFVTLKAVYSEALRMPDLLATDRNWRYYARDLDPLFDGKTAQFHFYRAFGKRTLTYEKILSREFILNIRHPDFRFNLDAKLFDEKRDGLISERQNFFNYDPTNTNRVDMQGVEFSMSTQLFSRLNTLINYAYIHSNATHVLDDSLVSDHSGSFSMVYKHNKKTQLSASYYFYANVRSSSYNSLETSLMKRFRLNRYDVSISFINRFHTKFLSISRGQLFGGTHDSSYDDLMHTFLSLKVKM